MLFLVVFGVPKKSVFTRLFCVFATCVLSNFQDRLVMSCCGTRNFLLALAHKISTAATPYASLLLPLAALGNVPTSITLRKYDATACITFSTSFSLARSLFYHNYNFLSRLYAKNRAIFLKKSSLCAIILV